MGASQEGYAKSEGGVYHWALNGPDGGGFFYPGPKLGDWISGFDPALDWRYCGPIIAANRIALAPARDDEAKAQGERAWYGTYRQYVAAGPTPLVAALRSLVGYHVGEVIPAHRPVCKEMSARSYVRSPELAAWGWPDRD
jgi:hypothetical protein